LSKIKAPGPGYIHLPEWYDEEHRAQLTAEKLVTRIVGGRPKRVWIKTRDRNEQLDLFAYALAALQQLGPAIVRGLGAIAKQIAAKAEQDKAQSSESPAVTNARKQAPARAGRSDI
jgi:phage terminase large subunit GpA-like protein